MSQDFESMGLLNGCTKLFSPQNPDRRKENLSQRTIHWYSNKVRHRGVDVIKTTEHCAPPLLKRPHKVTYATPSIHSARCSLTEMEQGSVLALLLWATTQLGFEHDSGRRLTSFNTQKCSMHKLCLLFSINAALFDAVRMIFKLKVIRSPQLFPLHTL